MQPPGFVSEADQVSLIFYLENGGRLYMESADIGKDMDGSILLDYLGFAFKGDGEEDEISFLNGDSNSFMAGVNYSYLGGKDAHMLIDHITAEEGSRFYSSEDSKTRMIVFDSADYKTISSSVTVGAFASGDSLNTRAYFISQIVDYFNDNINVGIDESKLNEMLASVISYPNPFVSEINIKYEVLREERIKIDIHDIQGRLINTLTDSWHEKGTYKLKWNAEQNILKPGVYFYKIYSGSDLKSGKMIYKR